MRKIAVVIYGPPGAGKGTQANLLAWKRDYVHFDSGRFLESVIHDPAGASNKRVQYEKKLFDSGMLMTPSWVVGMTSKKAAIIGRAGLSAVYSGSPRTMYEAFGAGKRDGIINVLQKYYGKTNLFFIYLNVRPEISIKRNTARKVCSICATVIAAASKAVRCPICAGALRKRSLDNPKVILERIAEYKKRTFPILTELKKRGYRVIKVNGEPLPGIVSQRIDKLLPH